MIPLLVVPVFAGSEGLQFFDCVERVAQPIGELQHLGGEHLRQFPDRFFPRRPVAKILVSHLRRQAAVESEQIVPQPVDPETDLVNRLDCSASAGNGECVLPLG